MTHYSMVNPHCSKFRIITAFFFWGGGGERGGGGGPNSLDFLRNAILPPTDSFAINGPRQHSRNIC